MEASLGLTTSRSSDRQVLYAMLLVGVLSSIMMFFEVMDRLEVKSYFTGLYSFFEISFEATVIGAVAWGGTVALRVMKHRRHTTLLAHEAREQVELLFHMTDMLQSALGYEDANAVLRSTASRLLPDFGGALYVFNNSGDRLEHSTSWAWAGAVAEIVTPSQCWALKRGKPHLNAAGPETLHCEHHDPGTVVLEIPMMARGEVYGLLGIQAGGLDAEESLKVISPIAGALADGMSLALSNIALRDKLRTQALRDPLTGLYNRRYMEDVLERFANLADRNHSPMSVLMIDLDHFKRINDEHGHALGDAILVAAAAAMMGAVRPCDVACRYGGEEFAIILPDCTSVDASAKAEILRARIELLSDNHGTRITASVGVATLLETSTRVADVLTHSDAALYRAKSEGRNRVVCAPAITVDGSVPQKATALTVANCEKQPASGKRVH